MLGVLPFGEDPDLSGTAGPAVPQHLPACCGAGSLNVFVFVIEFVCVFVLAVISSGFEWKCSS